MTRKSPMMTRLEELDAKQRRDDTRVALLAILCGAALALALSGVLA